MVSAYLIGSVPFGILVTRLVKGVDVRSQGSGHAGATNTMRAAGWLAGLLVLALDLGKGALVALLACSLDANPVLVWLTTGLVVAGHCWPVFARWRGGMGMATAGGVLLVTWPLGFVLGVGLAAALQLVVRHSARANLAGGLLLAPFWLLFGANSLQAGTALVAGLIIAVRASVDWRRVYRELWFDRPGEPGG